MSEENVVHQSQTPTGSKPSNFLKWFNPFFPGIGFKAWILQRLTGILLVVYLGFHFAIVGTLTLDSTGEIYNDLTRTLNEPLLHISGDFLGASLEKATSLGFMVDVGIIALLVYHGLNGLRVILFDLGIGIRRQKTLFWIFFIVGIVMWALACFWILIVPEIVL
ncbi:MAG: hypothetical protein ACXAC7_04345 [Candidatus Hodarchaeales archaeon]|jgi:succinate dehydrogenase / fumarate reductase cytochrome b subunit